MCVLTNQIMACLSDSISYVQYIWTAMENWGLIVYREDLFLLDDQKASYFDRINAALTISHEIAHNVSI